MENDNNIRAILLTCKPGSNPVSIPVNTPSREKRSISRKIRRTDSIFYAPLIKCSLDFISNLYLAVVES